MTPLKQRAEKLRDVILSLMNIPVKYDRKNGIPEGSYKAVLLEIEDFAKEAENDSSERC